MSKVDGAAIGAHLQGLLSSASLPEWMLPAAESLIMAALHTHGLDQPAKVKEFVRDGLIKLAADHDIKWLPDTIERPLEQALISIVVDVVFFYVSKEWHQINGTAPGYGHMVPPAATVGR